MRSRNTPLVMKICYIPVVQRRKVQGVGRIQKVKVFIPTHVPAVKACVE